MSPDPVKSVVPWNELQATKHAYEFVGSRFGDAPFSLIIINAPIGAGPNVHRHPYIEVFVVQEGEGTFYLDGGSRVVGSGHVVVCPPNVAHGFTNTGDRDLVMVAIHGAPDFVTEWLTDVDSQWVVRAEEA